MMNKKKFMVIALSALMAVSVIGCGTKSEDQASESTAQSEQKTYDVAKYVTLPAYKNMDVTVSGTYEVTEDDVRDYVNNMCSYYPEYEDTDKTVVENGDCVDIDYEGKKDGVAFDGGTAQGYVLEIGSGTFIDGFEDGLIGVKVGETVDLNLTFPENYQSEDLAGADVVFTVTVNKIKTKKEINYDTMTDEYVKSNLKSDSVEAFKGEVENYLKSQNESKKTTAQRQAVLEQLVAGAKIAVPDGLLEQKVDQYLQQIENQNCSDGTSIDDYLTKNYQMTKDEFTSEMTKQMETTLEQELVLEAIAKDMKLELNEEGYQAFLESAVSSGQYESAEEYTKAYDSEYESGDSFLRNRFLLTQALTKVADQCNFTYQEAEEQ